MIAWLVACASHREPEAAVAAAPVAAVAPAVLLETAIASPDPSTRSLACAARATPDAPYGLDDEHATVRLAVAASLALTTEGRATLRTWARGVPADTEGLASVLGLLDAEGAAIAASRWAEPAEDWQRAPLAIAAAAVDDDAVAFVATWLRTADLPWDPSMFAALGRSGVDSLIEPLRVAEARAEPELVPSIALARHALGDTTAAGPLRDALAHADAIGRLAWVERALLLSRPEPILRDVQGDDGAARLARAALAPSGAALAGLRADDDDVAEIAAVHIAAWTNGDPPRAACRAWRQHAALGAPRVRAAWTGPLGLCGHDGVDALHGLLADEHARVRTAAASVLIRGGTPLRTTRRPRPRRRRSRPDRPAAPPTPGVPPRPARPTRPAADRAHAAGRDGRHRR